MALAERQKRENFEIKYHFLQGHTLTSKKPVIREIECDVLSEIGASFDADEIVFTVNRPGSTETVEVDGIKLSINTDISATEDNERSIMIRATLKSRQERNIVVVLNAALQDGVERQIIPCTEHHQLLCVSPKSQTTEKIAIMRSVSQRIYSMFMMGFCSLTVKIRLYRRPSTPSESVDVVLDEGFRRQKDFEDDDDEVVFVVEDENVPIRRSALAKCSKFLAAYSQSSMAEAQRRIFPIKGCSLPDFHQLLSVSRGDREINETNVDSILELADRFIMPQILSKCELYLATSRDYGTAELLYLADRYRLHLLALFVMNKIHSEDELIALMEYEGFEWMSGEMKAVVWKRFHTLSERNM